MSETIFTKIINREIPADIVYEDGLSLAFRDINPQAPVHLLIIPKKAIATINDIEASDREVVGPLYWVTGKLAKDMGFADDGYREEMNCGGHVGLTVLHMHLHLLAGKPLGWPPYTDKMKQA